MSPSNVVAAGMHVVYSSGKVTEQTVKAFWSDDGGITWNESAPLSLTTSLGTYTYQADPVLAFDRTGVVFLSTLVVAGTPGAFTRSGILLWRSSDGGRTWSAPLPVIERDKLSHIGMLGPIDDKPWMAVDSSGGSHDGTIYLSWINFDVAGRLFTRSTDGGHTWSPLKRIGSVSIAPQVVVGNGNDLHIIDVTNTSLFSQTSHDAGDTFSDPVTIASLPSMTGTLPNLQIPLYSFPSSAIDLSSGPHRGSIYTLWATSGDAYPAGGATFPAAIWSSQSVDGGGTWSTPRRLSDPSLLRDAMFPSVACDPASGAVLIAWLDRRDDPENRLARVYATRSNDGGASFAQPRAFTSTLDLTGASFVGHYNGTAAHDGVSLTAFSDAAGFMGVTPLLFDEPTKRHRAVRH